MSSWFFSSTKQSQPATSPVPRSPALSLLYYEPGLTPPSARVDRKLKLQPRRPLRIWEYWKFATILAAKATEVTSDVLSHHIWGPRRKTWGIEMTIITSLIRGADRHSALVDIGTIRLLMSIGGLVPVPSDALVTPVTIRVKGRNLRGILSELDAKEDGTRELSGEWVVGRKTWQRMQKEWKAAKLGSPTPSRSSSTSSTDTPVNRPKAVPKRKELVVLYIHGGAYYLSSAAVQRIISIPLAKYTDSRVFALDYRLAPETRFPGPLHDVVTAYLRLVEDLHIPPENIIISGDSAGGGLSLALLMYLRDNDYPLPSGAILMSPWVDLTMSCESWETNAPYDVVLFPTADNHMNPIALYLGEKTEEYLTHPYVSPLFGDFKGLPPLLIQAGDAEVLRDEIKLLAHKASSAGVQVMLELYEDAIHVFQAYPFLEASKRSFESMHNFLQVILPQHRSRSPQFLPKTTERGLEQEIENDRMVVVGGDGSEMPSTLSKLSQMEKFGEKQNSKPRVEGSDCSSDDDPSWIQSPMWPNFSQERQKAEEFNYVDLQDIPDLQLSPLLLGRRRASLPSSPTDVDLTFFPSSSTVLSRHSSEPILSSSNSKPVPRRIQSTSSLAAQFTLHFRHQNESASCPTSPPPSCPSGSPCHTFHFDVASSPPTTFTTDHPRKAYLAQLTSAGDLQSSYSTQSPLSSHVMDKGRASSQSTTPVRQKVAPLRTIALDIG